MLHWYMDEGDAVEAQEAERIQNDVDSQQNPKRGTGTITDTSGHIDWLQCKASLMG
jgi:hypothetical protein